MMDDKLKAYSDVLRRLVAETVACSPKEWSRGTLTIESDGTRIDYKLKNEGQPGQAAISETLRDLIDELYVRCAHNGDTWTVATVSFHRENNDVNFKTNFKYSKPAAPEPTKRPWWKFGG